VSKTIKPKKPYNKICDCCGATFSRKPEETYTEYKNRSYCTLDCKKTLHEERMVAKAKKKYGENCLDDRPCKCCKKPIKYADFDTPSDFMSRAACSKECATILRGRTKRSKKSQEPTESRIETVSEWLGRMKKSDRLEQMAVCMGLIR
jgi:hypothetical protein